MGRSPTQQDAVLPRMWLWGSGCRRIPHVPSFGGHREGDRRTRVSFFSSRVKRVFLEVVSLLLTDPRTDPNAPTDRNTLFFIFPLKKWNPRIIRIWTTKNYITKTRQQTMAKIMLPKTQNVNVAAALENGMGVTLPAM